jgi:hypothetical protein
VLEWLQANQALDAAWHQANSLVERACELARHYDSDASHALIELGGFLLARNH